MRSFLSPKDKETSGAEQRILGSALTSLNPLITGAG
jgi:hypothetical protein